MNVTASGDEILVAYKPTSRQAAILREYFSAFERHAHRIDHRDRVCEFRIGIRCEVPRSALEFTMSLSHRACRLVAVGRRQRTLEAVTVYTGWLQKEKAVDREDVFIVHYAGFPIPDLTIDGFEPSSISSLSPLEQSRHEIMSESIRVPRAQLKSETHTPLAANEGPLYDVLFFFKRTPSQRIVTKFLARDPAVQRAASRLAATPNAEPITATVPVLCYDSKNGGQCRVLLSGYLGEAILMNERITCMLTPNSDVFTDANRHCRLLPGYVAPAGTSLSKVAHLNRYELIDDFGDYGYDVPAVEDAVLQRDCVEKLAFYGRHCNVDMNAVNAAVNEMPIPPTFGRLRAALDKLDQAATNL